MGDDLYIEIYEWLCARCHSKEHIAAECGVSVEDVDFVIRTSGLEDYYDTND